MQQKSRPNNVATRDGRQYIPAIHAAIMVGVTYHTMALWQSTRRVRGFVEGAKTEQFARKTIWIDLEDVYREREKMAKHKENRLIEKFKREAKP